MQTVFMILTNFPPAGLGEGGKCNSTLLSQSPVCVHWNQQEFGHQLQGEQEWGLNSLCNHVSVFSVSQVQKVELQADAGIQQNKHKCNS